MTLPAAAQAPDSDAYSYRPSALGGTWSFRLTGDAFTWDTGHRSGRIPYRDVTRVRLSYQPVTMQTQRFRTEIWSQNTPKLQFISTSWRSMVEQERQDAAYVAFVEELHRRITAAGGAVDFQTGVHPLRYWPGVIVFVVINLALAGLTARALAGGFWTGAAMTVVFLGLFLWQVGNYFRRNRPRAYDPRAVPAEAFPPRKR